MKPLLKFRSDNDPILSPDGKHVSPIVRDVTLFNIESKKKVWNARPFSYALPSSFDSTGQKLAVKSTSGQIAVLDAATGSVLVDFKNKDDGEGSNVCFSDCGGYLIDGSWKGVLTVRSIDDGAIVAQHAFDRQMIKDVAFIDGHLLVHHSHKMGPHSFTRWKWPITEREFDTFPYEPSRAEYVNFISADSFIMAYGYPLDQVMLVNRDGAEEIFNTSEWGNIHSLGRSPTGKFFVCAVQNKVLFIDAETHQSHQVMELKNDDDRALGFTFSADGARMAVCAYKESCVVDVKSILPDKMN